MQLLLPFTNLQVTDQHLAWLRLANAADYPERKHWFYPFKSRWLRAHAVSDGFDLQTIEKKCWCGDGIWRGVDDDLPRNLWRPCCKCAGTGIYLRKEIVLARWLVRDAVFHTPTEYRRIYGPGYHATFAGLIQHDPVSSRSGQRAMDRLFLRYEPTTFFRLWQARWSRYRDDRVLAFHWRVRRVRMQLARITSCSRWCSRHRRMRVSNTILAAPAGSLGDPGATKACGRTPGSRSGTMASVPIS